MISYLYILKNSMYNNNIYKIDISQQNSYQLLKQYNKFYITNTTIVYHQLLSNSHTIYTMLLNKYNIINGFVECDINDFIKELINLINNTSIDPIIINIDIYIEPSNNRTINDSVNNVNLNDIYTLYNVTNKLPFLDFVYHLQQNTKYNIIYTNNKYYLQNYVIKHMKTNIYEQFITNNIYVSINCTLTHRKAINYFKQWIKRSYPYLTCPHKSILKKNIVTKINTIFNLNPSIKNKQISWTNLTIK